MSDKLTVAFSDEVENEPVRAESATSISRISLRTKSSPDVVLSRVTTEEINREFAGVEGNVPLVRKLSAFDQKSDDVLDLVKHGYITKEQGNKLIEEYKEQDRAKKIAHKELLKRKVFQRQNTTEGRILDMLQQGQLTEEEAAAILEDIREDSETVDDFELSNTKMKRGTTNVGRKMKRAYSDIDRQTNGLRGFSKHSNPTSRLRNAAIGIINVGNAISDKKVAEDILREETTEDIQREEVEHYSTAISINSKGKFFFIFFLVCICVYLVIILPTSYSYVDIDEIGIRIDRYSGAIVDAEKVYLPGRYDHGGFQDFITYKSYILQVHLLIEGQAYSGADFLPYQIGKFANSEIGPVTARAKDGEKYDVEVSLSYQIDKDSLVELHRYYGGFKQLNESLYDDTRYNVRNILSLYTVEDILTRRESIEKTLQNALKTMVEERKLKFVTLSIGRIIMSESVNTRLFDKELNKQKIGKIIEEGKLLNISKYTEYLLKLAEGKREKYLSVQKQLVANKLLLIEKELKQIEAVTVRKVDIIKQHARKNASIEYTERTNYILNESLKYLKLQRYMDLDVATINMGTLKLKHENMKDKTAITSSANLFQHLNISKASNFVEKLKASNYVEIYGKLRSTLGVNRLKLLNLEWIKYQMGDILDNNKHFNFDTQLPAKFGN
eukprot:g5415.t1